MSTVVMDHGLGNGDMGKGFKMNRSKGNFSKKHQARVMEHVSVKPNERRKKLSLLQIQRGEVIKYKQIGKVLRNAKRFLLS